MPIYAYRCEACGFAKDVLQKVSDPQLTVCLSCNAPSFKKQLTAAGFQLKGTGWYATDFKNGGNKPAAKEGNEAGDNADSSGSEKAAGDKATGDKATGDKKASEKAIDGAAAGGGNGADQNSAGKSADSKPAPATATPTTTGTTAGASSAIPSSKV